LEAALHETWGDGWHERDKPEPAPNPYNILTRVPEDFLKLATEIATERSQFLEKNLDEHLFPGLFPKREISLEEVLGARDGLRASPLRLLEPRIRHVVVRASDGRVEDPCLGCACPPDWFFEQPALSQLPHGHELPGSERTEVAHHRSCPKYFDDGNGEPDAYIRHFCGICCNSYERCGCAATVRR